MKRRDIVIGLMMVGLSCSITGCKGGGDKQVEEDTSLESVDPNHTPYKEPESVEPLDEDEIDTSPLFPTYSNIDDLIVEEESEDIEKKEINWNGGEIHVDSVESFQVLNPLTDELSDGETLHLDGGAIVELGVTAKKLGLHILPLVTS